MEIYVRQLVETLKSMIQGAADLTPRLIIAIIVFSLFVFLAKFAKKITYSLFRQKTDYQNLAVVFSRLSSLAVIVFGVLTILGIIFPSVTPANLLSLLGVGGVAIGFAFKEIFQNFLAGILILLMRTFKIGDQIEVDGVEGTVEDIEIRATSIRTYDNRKVVIPNSTLFTQKITINTGYSTRRVSVSIGIGYADDIQTAKKVILTSIENIKGVLKDPAPHVLVTGYGSSSVDLELRFWLIPERIKDVPEVKNDVLEVIKPALFAVGIDIPFPIRKVYFEGTPPQ